MYKLFLIVSFFVCVLGCKIPNSDGCTPNELRCEGQTLELCDPKAIWEEQYRCSDFGLVCCPSGGEFDCLESCI